tara:strand:- start:558 stop:773 length:216 start_codon:yes stop_codon:yes gene_type:complete
MQALVKQWFAQIGVNELSDNDVLSVIRTFKLDKLSQQYVFMLKMVSPIVFLILSKLQDETIDWGDLNELPK